ncbi:Serine/threonine-protein phosphatase, partial [Ananas comosus]
MDVSLYIEKDLYPSETQYQSQGYYTSPLQNDIDVGFPDAPIGDREVGNEPDTYQMTRSITWRPYTDAVLEVLPAFCVQGSEVWRSWTTLICFHIVELHVPDRVLRQFGLLQYIPIHVETIRRFTSQGRPDEHWGHFHAAHIERWGQRLQAIIDQHLIVGDDPVQATSIYMEWYWQITRRWISCPVQRPPLTYQPRGQTERALNQHAKRAHNKDTIIFFSFLSRVVDKETLKRRDKAAPMAYISNLEVE